MAPIDSWSKTTSAGRLHLERSSMVNQAITAEPYLPEWFREETTEPMPAREEQNN